MRYMILLKGEPDPAASGLPDEKIAALMNAYNEELVRAGVLLSGEGLYPSSKGARVRFSGGKRTVLDGPFTESKELIAGYYLIQVKSKEEAIEWASRVPVEEVMQAAGLDEDVEIEVRQVFDAADSA
jgi:hypothetical protein